MFLLTRNQSPFFKTKVRGDPSSQLRVGISPDLTVAYIDFLFDDGLKSVLRPLNRLGQPRFPLSLRICGLGTYFSPWYVDTNDVLLQAISQSSEFAVFIDKAWINFIIELNKVLKTIHKHHLQRDLIKLMKFLADESKTGGLGGLLIHFCTFLSDLQTTSSSSSSAASSSLISSAAPPSRLSASMKGLDPSNSSTSQKNLRNPRMNTNSAETFQTDHHLTEFGRMKSTDRTKKTGDHTLVSFIFGRDPDDISLTDSTWTDDHFSRIGHHQHHNQSTQSSQLLQQL